MIRDFIQDLKKWGLRTAAINIVIPMVLNWAGARRWIIDWPSLDEEIFDELLSVFEGYAEASDSIVCE